MSVNQDFYKAVSLYKDKKYNEAQVIFEELSVIHPKNKNEMYIKCISIYNSGTCYLRNNNFEQALERFLKSYKTFSLCPNLIVDSDYYNILYNSFLCYYELKNYKKALIYGKASQAFNNKKLICSKDIVRLESVIKEVESKLEIEEAN